MSKTEALSTTTKGGILALRGDAATLVQTVRENVGNETLSSFDLDRIKVPAGGGTFWSVPTMENPDGEPQKSVAGVIVYTTVQRAYWATPFGDSGGGTPPDCFSTDTLIGIGTPGGPCAHCAFAQFGSDAGGIGQACKQFRTVFLLREQGALPAVIVVPPGSLKNLKRYLLSLASNGLPYWSVVTEFALVQAKSKGGVTYSQVSPKMARRLDEGEVASARAYSETIRPLVADVQIIEQTEVAA